jgi:hypothetical protein
MTLPSLFARALLCGAAVTALMVASAAAQSEPKFYYWVTPHPALAEQNSRPESFVIEVGPAIKASIEEIRANGGVPGLIGRIAAGAVPYNKDYYAPGQPVWNWHVAAVSGIFNHNERSFVPCPPACNPNNYDDPSDIAANPEQWIQRNGEEYVPARYWIGRQIDPSKKDAVANVSNRGMTGAGEKALITGFIIKGGEPRNVVVRALGPSMSAAGVQQVAANPKIEVFTASGRSLASNNDWKTNARSGALAEAYPALAPKDDKEAALLLTLMPGSYTLHGTNEDGTEGVVLLEAYDVDSSSE